MIPKQSKKPLCGGKTPPRLYTSVLIVADVMQIYKRKNPVLQEKGQKELLLFQLDTVRTEQQACGNCDHENQSFTYSHAYNTLY